MNLASRYFIFLLLLSGIFLTGCGANRLTYYNTLNNYAAEKNYAEANKYVESRAAKFYGENDLLLYYLDQGYLYHLGAEYSQSNLMLAAASRLSKELFTKSISQEAYTFLTSDNMRPYYGEDFEQAMVHVFSALNYIFLNKGEDALVEARAADDFFKLLQTNYSNKDTYQEDAFVRYLMGMIYENEGETNDAFISYRKALYTYRDQQKFLGRPIPQELFNSTMDTAAQLKFNSEQAELLQDFPDLAENYRQSDPAVNLGEIVVLHYNGRVPHKIDNILEIAFNQAWGYIDGVRTEGEAAESIATANTVIRSIAANQQIVAAFPQYIPTNYSIISSMIELQDQSKQTEVVEDIGKIAVKSLNDRIGRIYAKTFARAALKFALSKAAVNKIEQKNDNALGAFILSSTVKVAAALTEKADKRCWQILPDTIRMARFNVPAGLHDLKISYYDRQGLKTGAEAINNVIVKKRKKTFVLVQTNY